MRIDADRRTALGYGEPALHASAVEAEQGARDLCEVIVNALVRDHTLRHAYLRKRWQGVGFGERRPGGGAAEAVRRKPKDIPLGRDL